MAMLEVKNLGISFGGLRAVDDFHISIDKGQLYGLIGPNGAGKTTVFNMLTGVYTPDDGNYQPGWCGYHRKENDRHQQGRYCAVHFRTSVCLRIRACLTM